MRRNTFIIITLTCLLSACAAGEGESARLHAANLESDAQVRVQAAPPTAADAVVLQALTLLGVGYQYAGKIPQTGFDCSGLVRYVYHEARGVELPNTALELSRVGKKVERDALQPGDLVFYNTLRHAFSHVGIYLGENRFIHAPRLGSEVRIEDMSSQYWVARFDGARRIVNTSSQ
jgi:cell wall-associated NlpC family hydrolase